MREDALVSAHFVDEQHGASLRDVVAYDASLGKVSPHWVGLPLRAISSRARA